MRQIQNEPFGMLKRLITKVLNKKGSHIMGFQGLDEGRNNDAMLSGIEVLTCKERIEIIRPQRRIFQKAQSMFFGDSTDANAISATFDDVCQVLRVRKFGEIITEIPYSAINYTEMYCGADDLNYRTHDLHIKHDGGVLPLAADYSRSQCRKVLAKLRQATMVPVII